MIGVVHISGILVALLLVPKLEAFGFKLGFEIAGKWKTALSWHDCKWIGEWVDEP